MGCVMTSYGQFCAVAKAMELLDERWTLLVVRELLAGSTHFNELRRGNPKMSPALLSKRLRSLERAGVIERMSEAGRGYYRLTRSGQELRPVVEALGVWGSRWIGELGESDLDPHLLMWDMKRTIPVERWPRERTVVAIRFTDVDPQAARWWICVADGAADVCDYDPGYEVTAWVWGTLRTLVEIWRGDRSWPSAIASDDVQIDGVGPAQEALPTWLSQSHLAAVPRPA